MGSGKGVLNRLDQVSSQQLSLVSFVLILGLSGIAVLVWMAAAGWKDITGVIVGVIFIVLTILQVAFAITWWRSQKKITEEYVIKDNDISMGDKVQLNDTNAIANDSGDKAHSGLLVTDVVKGGYTDGAHKVDAEVIAV